MLVVQRSCCARYCSFLSQSRNLLLIGCLELVDATMALSAKLYQYRAVSFSVAKLTASLSGAAFPDTYLAPDRTFASH